MYVTVFQSPRHHQISLEDLLCGTVPDYPMISNNTTNTRTYETWDGNRLVDGPAILHMIASLRKFNRKYEDLHNTEDRRSLYHSFKIPKRHGGWRQIDAPGDELMTALRELKKLLEEPVVFCNGKLRGATYHTSAFAYIKGRSTIDAVKRHQVNKSKWFAKLDLHDFFGSTTLDFVMKQLSTIYPFAHMMDSSFDGKVQLQKALSLAFLDGKLPQGTPVSPLITNLMMIPIDFKLSNGFREFHTVRNGKPHDQRFVYTRYADDFIISSRYDFNVHDVEDYVVRVLSDFEAPFTINDTKTRYGSSAGRNWNLGVMLNAQNQITVGNKKKRQFQCALHNFISDHKNGNAWSYEDLAHTLGLYSYYHMVEPDAIDGIIRHFNQKNQVNVLKMMKEAMKTDGMHPENVEIVLTENEMPFVPDEDDDVLPF